MKKEVKRITVYSFNEEEIAAIKAALEYCLHRINSEPSCGAKFLDKPRIESIARELRKTL